MTAVQLELITAAVDEELTALESSAFRALLSASAEARALYERLAADRARVRAQPRATPPADLRGRVMARLANVPRLAEPAPVRGREPGGRRALWATAAVAASLLVAACAAALGFVAGGGPVNRPARGGWAVQLPAPLDPATAAPSPLAPEQHAHDVIARPLAPVVPAPREVRPPMVATAPEPRTVRQDLIGSPLLPKLLPFERIDVRVPFLRPAGDLGREDVGGELLDELRRDPAFRFDLFARDAARGVDVFQNAARAAGLTVHADAATLDKLRKRQVQAAVVYTEALTAAELVSLFGRLPAEDAKFSPRVCDALHAAPVGRADELELKAVLGVDVGLFKRPVAPAPAAPERTVPSKSLSADTIDSVVRAVGGSAGKGGDKAAVLLTWQPGPGGARTNPAASAELKQYLQKRGDRKPNVVPAVIVIRPVG